MTAILGLVSAALVAGVLIGMWLEGFITRCEARAIEKAVPGFFGRLTPEQKYAALHYRGPDHHGKSEDTPQ